MSNYGHPGIDYHVETGRYSYPRGPKHYGLGILLCEATGRETTYVGTSHERQVGRLGRRICENCATPSERAASRSLAELNAERAPR